MTLLTQYIPWGLVVYPSRQGAKQKRKQNKKERERGEGRGSPDSVLQIRSRSLSCRIGPRTDESGERAQRLNNECRQTAVAKHFWVPPSNTLTTRLLFHLGSFFFSHSLANFGSIVQSLVLAQVINCLHFMIGLDPRAGS